MVTIYATAAGLGDPGPGSNPALGKHGHVTTRSSSESPGQLVTPTLPDANLRYQDALDSVAQMDTEKADGTSPFKFVGAAVLTH